MLSTYRSRKHIVISIGMLEAFILIVAYVKFFYLMKLPGTLGVRSNSIINIILSILMFVPMLLTRKPFLKSRLYWRYIVTFVSIGIVEIFYTKLVYPDEPIINAFRAASPFLVILSYFIFAAALNYNEEMFIQMIVDIATLLAIICVFQAIIYGLSGIKIIKLYGFSYGESQVIVRNGRIRILGSDYVSFVSFISMGLLYSDRYSSKLRRKAGVNVLLALVFDAFCTQTRAMLLAEVIVLTVVVFKLSKSKLFKTLMIFAVLVVCIISSSDIYQTLVDISLTITNRIDYSLYHRVDEYSFYFQSFLKRPIFGVGLLTLNPQNRAYFYLFSKNGYYAYSDVGIVGILAHFGILGLLLYLYPVINTYKIWRTSKKTSSLDTLNFCIFCGLIATMISLAIFDGERLMILPLYLALSEYSAGRTNQGDLVYV